MLAGALAVVDSIDGAVDGGRGITGQEGDHIRNVKGAQLARVGSAVAGRVGLAFDAGNRADIYDVAASLQQMGQCSPAEVERAVQVRVPANRRLRDRLIRPLGDKPRLNPVAPSNCNRRP